MDNTPNSRELVESATKLCPSITEDMSTDEVYERVQFADALVRAIKEWRDQMAEQELDYMRGLPAEGYEHTDVDGNTVWVYIGHDKKVTLRKGRERDLLAWVMENLSLEEFEECLASNWPKHGAMGSKLGDAKDEFFETTFSDKAKVRKTMPPAFKKQLQASDRAIVAEGGDA